LIAQVEYTWEHMRLGAIQGIVTDANGDTLVNWFDLLNQSAPSEIDFDLDNASPTSGAVRKKCNELTRAVLRAIGGLWLPGSSYLLALCGDVFWDNLTAPTKSSQTYFEHLRSRESSRWQRLGFVQLRRLHMDELPGVGRQLDRRHSDRQGEVRAGQRAGPVRSRLLTLRVDAVREHAGKGPVLDDRPR